MSGGDELADRLKLIEKAMDYGLIEVELASECPKDAIRVCKLLGLPDEILDNLRKH